MHIYIFGLWNFINSCHDTFAFVCYFRLVIPFSGASVLWWNPNTWSFHGECNGSLLGIPNLATAHLIASHLIVAHLAHLVVIHLVVIHLIAAHLVAHLVASHLIVGIATIPQVANFTNGCTNLRSKKRRTCIVGVSQFLHLTGSWGKNIWKPYFTGLFPVSNISHGSWKLRFLKKSASQQTPTVLSYPMETILDYWWDFHVCNLVI